MVNLKFYFGLFSNFLITFVLCLILFTVPDIIKLSNQEEVIGEFVMTTSTQNLIIGLIVSIVIASIPLVIQLIATIRDGKKLSGEHTNLKETLSKEHTGLKEILSIEHTGLKEILSIEHDSLSKEHENLVNRQREIRSLVQHSKSDISIIKRDIEKEIEEQNKYKNAQTLDMRSFEKSMDELKGMYKSLEIANFERKQERERNLNLEQQLEKSAQKITELQQENQQLKQHVQSLTKIMELNQNVVVEPDMQYKYEMEPEL